MDAVRAIASLGGVGFLRPAPGTWGSLAVMPLALLPPWVALLAAFLFTGLGYWALTRLPETGADPGWVVIDGRRAIPGPRRSHGLARRAAGIRVVSVV